ncbi:hypothetical protein [Streptomyces sp. GC420]|uniref:hypothetical protein n=1 Tax=Streptomyces sp. GC420 TaxID=2697568 RepID=UPI0014152267|nr:hypothetical protein [Streptomyces sp. GC420]NBM19161.1 hypothetical protein [Streptomyces sp. GC420]
MEQRTGQNFPPVTVAVTDPAYIPGLTAPSPAATEDAVRDEAPEGLSGTGAETSKAAETLEADTQEEAPAAKTAEAGTPGRAVAGSESESESESDEDAMSDGPAFTASDFRGSIAADRSGVRFRLDDQEAEFDWEEIGAVEVTTSRFGRRLTVTVHMAGNRWYPADIDADKARVKEWTEQLDAVLDAYFQE